MIIKTVRDGYCYISPITNKRYQLLEGISLGGDTTSDIVIIIDNKIEKDNNCVDIIEAQGSDTETEIIGFFYGATNFNREYLSQCDFAELDILVSYYVKKYEKW